MKDYVKKARPVLRYHGGKWRIGTWIISYFPEHRIYTEAYGGGASVLLKKPRSYAEVYNDLDGEVVNLFLQMRDAGPELRERLRLTPYARSEFAAAYEPTDDPIERARRTIIKSFMGFGSDAIQKPTGFRANSNRSRTTPAHDWAHYPDALDFAIERLRGVVIENRDALGIIRQHDGPETLHYVDPPYVHKTRKLEGGHRYRFEMTDDQHRELAAALHACRGKVVLSGYKSPLYEWLYRDWFSVEKQALADGAQKRTEILWFNFPVIPK